MQGAFGQKIYIFPMQNAIANAKANTPLVIGSWTREQFPIFHNSSSLDQKKNNSSSNLKLLKLENHSFTISLLNQFIVVSTYKNRSLYKEWLLNIKKKTFLQQTK